jgi:hypothetical protein
VWEFIRIFPWLCASGVCTAKGGFEQWPTPHRFWAHSHTLGNPGAHRSADIDQLNGSLLQCQPVRLARLGRIWPNVPPQIRNGLHQRRVIVSEALDTSTQRPELLRLFSDN